MENTFWIGYFLGSVSATITTVIVTIWRVRAYREVTPSREVDQMAVCPACNGTGRIQHKSQ